jgi:hypothetical protein
MALGRLRRLVQARQRSANLALPAFLHAEREPGSEAEMVTVHQWEWKDGNKDSWVRTSWKASEEQIRAIMGGTNYRRVEGTAEEVDEARLTAAGRYYPPNSTV